MRMGRVVPGLRVMLRKAGRGGGGGGGGGSCGRGGAASATCGEGLSSGAGWRTMGADFDLTGPGCFGLDAAGVGGGGSAGGADGGGGGAATGGVGGLKLRLFYTGFSPRNP